MPRGKVTEQQLRASCEELERRLRGREPCRAEDFFQTSPELTDDAETALDLIYAEYLTRSDLGETPAPEEYYARFPQWREPLYHQFQIHALLEGALPGEAPAPLSGRVAFPR